MTSTAPAATRGRPHSSRPMPALVNWPTPREIAVLGLLAQDFRWPEIARELDITVNSARGYARQAHDALGVSSLPAAMAAACARNVIVMPGDRFAIPSDVLAKAIGGLTELAHGDLSQQKTREYAENLRAELARHAALLDAG